MEEWKNGRMDAPPQSSNLPIFGRVRLRNGMNDHEKYSPWLHRFAVLVVVVTFLVIISGGNVTSRGAGLSVPDGFTVFGHFLWTFPMERWVGNIFHEHIHRLKGSIIGVLIIVLAFWLLLSQRRPWLRLVGLATLGLVLIQGILGAWRVDRISTTYAIIHGIHAQIILCMTVWIAAATSRYWGQRVGAAGGAGCVAGDVAGNVEEYSVTLRRVSILLLAALGVQLVLGALVRHHGASLAIPDFPAHYGGFFPPFTDSGIEAAHDAIVSYDQTTSAQYPTPFQVAVHFSHRIWALPVVAIVIWLITCVAGRAPSDPALLRPSMALACLLIAQVTLGVCVVTSGRLGHFATAHQATGAAILGTAALLMIRLHALRPLHADGVAPHPASTVNSPLERHTA